MTRRRGGWLVLGLATVATVGGLLWWLYRAPARVDLATYWQLVVAVLSLLVALAPLVRAALRSPRRRGDDAVQERLAESVAARWEKAAGERGLVLPRAMRLHWTVVPTISVPRAAALESTAFPAVPGYAPPAARFWARGGDVHELHELNAGLPTGRLVVAGPPGSGKSAAAMLLVVDSLRRRSALPPAERAGFPVPVLLPLAGWDPAEQSLADRLVEQLQRTHERFFAGRRGAASARRLLDDGRLMLVLDGLDELAGPDGTAAVRQLNTVSACRVVVTSRSEELVAVGGRLLYGAVAVTLDPVAGADAADYLTGIRPVDPSRPWGDLVGRLRDPTGDPLARALDTPLMITMVRDGLRDDDDVAAFLALGEAHDLAPRAVEDHLLDHVVETAYRPSDGTAGGRTEVEGAQHALTWIATRMTRAGVRDLAWWDLPLWAPLLPRALVVGAVTGVIMFGVAGASEATDTYALLAGLGGVLGAYGSVRLGGGSLARRGARRTRPGRAFGFGFGAALGLLSIEQLAIVRLSGSVTVVVLAVVVVVSAAAGAAWIVARLRHRRRSAPARFETACAVVLGLGASWVGLFASFLLLREVWIVRLLLLIALCGVGLALRMLLSAPRGAVEESPVVPSARSGGTVADLAVWFALAVTCDVAVLWVVMLIAQVVPGAPAGDVGLSVVIGATLGFLFPTSGLAGLAALQLAAAHRLPPRLRDFLDDARMRGVLRSAGPLLQFRHADLQARLAERGPDRGRGDGRPADGADPWRPLPEQAARGPRSLVVGLAAGVVCWLGFCVVSAEFRWTTVAAVVGVLTGLGGALGALLSGARTTRADPTPDAWRWVFRRPARVGAACGFAFGVDLNRFLPPGPATLFAVGLVWGALFWLVVGMLVRPASGGVARRRWRAITGAVPTWFRVLLAFAVGDIALYATTAVSVEAVVVLHVLMALALLAAGLRTGLGSTPSGQAGDSRRDRVTQLLVWLVAGGVGAAFVVRTEIRGFGGLGADQSGPFLLYATAAALAVPPVAWGLVLGLAFPATWLTSLARVRPAVRGHSARPPTAEENEPSTGRR